MKTRLTAACALVLLACAVMLALRSCGGTRRAAGGSGGTPEARGSAGAEETAAAARTRAAGETAEDALIDDSARARELAVGWIETCLAELRTSRHPRDARDAVARLMERLRNAPDDAAAAAAVVDFLKSGADCPTGLPFEVGPDGVMASVPTLRTALLDVLPSLDPSAALDVAREIIRRMDSQNEYALALRNVAWNDLDGDLRGELSAAFRRMLDEGRWAARPDAGFLEAMDVALVVPAPDLFTRISTLAAERPPEGGDAMLHAACMTLDRMALRDPSLLETAWRDPRWMAALPAQRASLMSRIDIAEESQRRLLTDYLSDPRTGERERGLFAAMFPNGNYLHSHRLASVEERTPGIDERARMDREVLEAVERLAESAEGPAAEALETIRARLAAGAGD